MFSDYIPVFVQLAVALFFGVAALLTSIILGQKGRLNKAKDSAYECGMISEGSITPRFSVKFYLVAMLFILFDIELIFMYTWAVSFQDLLGQNLSGIPNGIFWGMIWFLALFIVGEIYCLKKGAFDWK
ncbi:MAG: NADH-quinone oxidoreductase subunit A [Verrucomicrobiota bacterium]|nr:NADH-quinone oxidoreductase subunit A [Verrucomicrobiota bacterium]